MCGLRVVLEGISGTSEGSSMAGVGFVRYGFWFENFVEEWSTPMEEAATVEVTGAKRGKQGKDFRPSSSR